VEVRNVDTNLAVMSGTNGDGLYTIPSLRPGHYVMSVRKPGFKTVSLTQLDLNVQDNVVRNFALEVGSSSESVTVTAEGGKINTTDATVSTVVDRNFAENLPMNGRSFQTLIQLTPGVVTVQSNALDGGQFSVNGQRASSNYWTVDGVSANIGASANFNAGNGIAGALPSFSVVGGTNSLVSVDALQEFRLQTSTYAPEFGRSPGGQVSILTRSGTNQFHGTLFDYLRNDIFDANDWFADRAGQPKPEERQNDFGGTFSGPIFKSHTFFFFSYEGLHLRLPQVALTTVPDLASRQSATGPMQPFLNAYPLPNGADLGNGVAEFDASFSSRSTLDAYSLRLDHRVNDRLSVFGRYNYSPSTLLQRGFAGEALSELSTARNATQTGTIGATLIMSPSATTDLRVNYSSSNASGKGLMDNFGGAAPLLNPPFPAPFDARDAQFGMNVSSLSNTSIGIGKIQQNIQRQINIVGNVSLQVGTHSLKFGADFRRLTPLFGAQSYGQVVAFSDVASAESGTLQFSLVRSGIPATLLFRNLGVFAQDTWRALPRLTLTYGLRWDVDFAPSSLHGPSLLAITGFNLEDLSQLAVAPSGTPPFHTPYNNVAPRVGVAYQVRENPQYGLVLRGGFGLFYDLATQETGNNIVTGSYPFGASRFAFGGTFPLSPSAAAPPPATADSLSSGALHAFDPNLRLPYTIEWNLALEQVLGKQQSLSASYVGAAGRRLIQTAEINSPTPDFAVADLITNSATSDYDALQVQFQRRSTHGLQALASYVLSHSIDSASAGSVFGNEANALVPGFDPNVNRSSSDFDVRQAVSAGLSYDPPPVRIGAFIGKIVNGWSVQTVIQARSAPPVNIFDSNFFEFANASAEIRPDVVQGQPFYLSGPQFPGGKALNPAAFVDPPVDANGNPIRQGDLGRNAARAFGAFQWDFALHRSVPIRESIKLEFRAEAFNLLNHPNFGPPVSDLSNQSQFGQSVQMLGRSLVGVGSSGSGAFDPLYQIGGPRSLQFALKLLF
jgi:hypothetical protein